ncbi:hypothetical protein [Phocaeicola vulgatus]|uniref:hypothetical protein n=1 Tax=Phocaeicola vulgatus TaxID=821 RepID=UPI0039B4FE3A
MKKFLSNTIVQLLIAVIIGLLAGFVVNDAVLEVVICIKHITGQIIEEFYKLKYCSTVVYMVPRA